MVRTAEALAREFFGRVWAPPHDLDATDELMTEDDRITTAGQVVEGRAAFKAGGASMQELVRGATNEHREIITDAAGDRVVSRWVARGANDGMFGLPADGRPVEFSGIAIWRVEGGRLAECWGNAARSNCSTGCDSPDLSIGGSLERRGSAEPT